jgi:phage repressor protein C with HTH and peptisase S24 domain
MDKSLINKRFNDIIIFLLERNYAETKAEIAQKLGISQSKFSEILAERMNVNTELVARLVHHYPNLSLEWILLGKGEPEADKSNKPTNNQRGMLPLLPISAVAGWNGVDAEGINIDECDQMVVPYLVDAGAEFLIRVTGNSMYPTYANGDILACRRVRESRNIQWGKVYVIDSEEGPMVKRINLSDDEEHILCQSDNHNFAPFTLRKSEIRSLALVVGSIQVE